MYQQLSLNFERGNLDQKDRFELDSRLNGRKSSGKWNNRNFRRVLSSYSVGIGRYRPIPTALIMLAQKSDVLTLILTPTPTLTLILTLTYVWTSYV